MFMVHRRELVKQSAKSFLHGGVSHGIISSNFPEDYRPLTQIASVQTLVRRLNKVARPKLIVWDECHHISAGTWDKIFRHYHDAFHIGLTATPRRLDGKGLNNHFTKLIKGPTVDWLIDNKYLTPYKLFMPSTVQTTGLRKQMGDYRKSDAANLVNTPKIIGSAIREYKKVCDGKRAVVFCVSVAHSQQVVKDFQASGISAIHVDGETPSHIRDEAIRQFEAGEIKVMSNVDLFGEGFDLPALEAVILMRPTQSLGLYLQQVGRVLRTAPGKETAFILDHVGNVLRHGLPDEPREWSLNGEVKGMGPAKDAGPTVRICTACFAAQMPGPVCKFCGTPFETQGRKVEEEEGDLVEIDKTMLRRKKMRAQAKAETMDDLVALAEKRGYKRPRGWAKHIFNARQAKKNKGMS